MGTCELPAVPAEDVSGVISWGGASWWYPWLSAATRLLRLVEPAVLLVALRFLGAMSEVVCGLIMVVDFN